jgi:hypothetical protein
MGGMFTYVCTLDCKHIRIYVLPAHRGDTVWCTSCETGHIIMKCERIFGRDAASR